MARTPQQKRADKRWTPERIAAAIAADNERQRLNHNKLVRAYIERFINWACAQQYDIGQLGEFFQQYEDRPPYDPR